MYLVLKKGILKELIKRVFDKTENIKEFSKKIKIPKSTLYLYYNEKRIISEKNLNKLESFLQTKISKEDIVNEISDNWKQIKGGINCVKSKKEKGTFEKQLKECRKRAIEVGTPNWHKTMKRDHPEEYYKSQWEKFKKIGEYKFTTKNGEKVRNILEKDIADTLKRLNVKYEYEKYINIKNKAFFPDFIINDKIIIECTMWQGFDKAIKLKNKISYLKDKYKVYVVIPKALNNYYQILNNHLVLGLDEFDPLAQTFPRQ